MGNSNTTGGSVSESEREEQAARRQATAESAALRATFEREAEIARRHLWGSA